MITTHNFLGKPDKRNVFLAEVMENGVGYVGCVIDGRTRFKGVINLDSILVRVTLSNHDKYMESGASLRRVSRITQQGGLAKLLTDEQFFFIQHPSFDEMYFKIEQAQECVEKKQELEQQGYILFAGKVFEGDVE